MTAADPAGKKRKFLARQPILGAAGDVFAYELLFRSGLENACRIPDLDVASRSIFDTAFLAGLQKITNGRQAFLNCSRDSLLQSVVTLLPKDQIVAEILENAEPDDELVAACWRLKEAGYVLALDDFVDKPAWEPLIDLASFIKVDFRLTPPEEQQALVSRYKSRGIQMLAEKVETQEEFGEARRMGYSLFQGYYFSRPEMMSHQDLPSSKLAYLELLQASLEPEFDIEKLASKIKREASLTYRLLRYLNSALFGMRTEIRSVQHALALLGERELRKWVSVVCVAVLGEGKPDELMTLPLIRGRFCELVAPLKKMASEANDLFLLGLLSVMDAVLDQPLEMVLSELPVRSEIRNALLSKSGVYSEVLDLTISQERGDWDKLSSVASHLKMEEERIPDLYVSAVEWATALRQNMRVAPAS
jgi:c-di-GMP-related signal transduction protein